MSAQLELNEWLDQLQFLSEELNCARSSSTTMMMQENARCPLAPMTSDGSLRSKTKPALPPKPQIDSYRYSMTNIQETSDVDLDVLLGELCALESQLNDGPASRCMKMTTKITLASTKTSKNGYIMNNYQSGTNLESIHSKMDLTCRPHSPDNDSAFCDNLSLMSGESTTSNGHRSRDSNASSTDSTRGSMTTPSPTQLTDTVQAQIKTAQDQILKENLTDEEQNARLKAEKIKIALEKMKEASVRKLYVKIFTPNDSHKSVLIDERWTVSYILRHLAEKNRVSLTSNHAVVERYDDLCMERIYEDHEHLVENILLWSRDSSNKLYFVERRDKNDVFINPQLYLMGDDPKDTMDGSSKRQLLDEFFGLSHVQSPEIEGFLYLKTEGKKAWKKHYFILRSSGLYYVPKGKSKSSKDLICLMQLEMAQIYNGIGWKKKYKAPSDFGFALKHPQIQVKTSRYIKYLCVEDEKSYKRWMTGLRLAKNGKQLYENFEAVQNYLESDEAKINSSKCENTSSTDYFKESIVIRPRAVDGASSVKTVASMLFASSADRPRSADIVRSGSICQAKRGSRQLTHVDAPLAPLVVDSPSNCRRNGATDVHLTQEIHFTNGFDSDFKTSTIKKQPTPISKPSLGAAHLPLTESTRQIHSVSMRFYNDRRTTDSSSCSVDSKGSTEDEPEADSDEELPIACSDSTGADLFPPPPSPLPMDLCSDMNEIKLETPIQSARMTLSATSLHSKSSEELNRKSSSLSVGATTIYPAALSVASSSTFCEEKFKRPPPPLPPKRSETTRLTTSLTSTTPFNVVTKSSNDFVVDKVSRPTIVAPKPKPTVSATNDFHSELQRATLRRLQQLQKSSPDNDSTPRCNGATTLKCAPTSLPMTKL